MIGISSPDRELLDFRKQVSLDHYKKLRKRMMSMNIEANRVSWSG